MLNAFTIAGRLPVLTQTISVFNEHWPYARGVAVKVRKMSGEYELLL